MSFNPKFEKVCCAAQAAVNINKPHDEDLTLKTLDMIRTYKNTEINSPSIARQIHSYIGKDLLTDTSQIGCWRTIEVTVGGNKTCPPALIHDEMTMLWSSLTPIEDPNTGIRIYKLVPSFFYKKFQEIHPFADGNGRVGGILFTAICYQILKEWWAPCQ